jgi:Fasciclin domain
VIISPFAAVYPGLFYVLNATGDFGIFLDLIDTLNLTQSLFGSEEYTIFAPTDEAFLKLGNITDDEEVLLAIVGAHFVEGFWLSTPKLTFSTGILQDGMVLTALSGNNLTVSINNETGVIMIDDAVVVLPDLPASNGIVQGIGTFYSYCLCCGTCVLFPLSMISLTETLERCLNSLLLLYDRFCPLAFLRPHGSRTGSANAHIPIRCCLTCVLWGCHPFGSLRHTGLKRNTCHGE